MNEIIQFFKERKWYYLLIFIVGIGIYRTNIHPISAYFVAVFLMTVFSLMKETSLSLGENFERVSNRRGRIISEERKSSEYHIDTDENQKDWSWTGNLIVLIAKFSVIGLVGAYLLWEIYNFVLWLTI